MRDLAGLTRAELEREATAAAQRERQLHLELSRSEAVAVRRREQGLPLADAFVAQMADRRTQHALAVRWAQLVREAMGKCAVRP